MRRLSYESPAGHLRASDFGPRTSDFFRFSAFGLRLFPLLFLAFLPTRSFACAACFGQTDSPLAEGMNWGILSLLAVVLLIWAGVIAVVVTIARRGARLAREQAAATAASATAP